MTLAIAKPATASRQAILGPRPSALGWVPFADGPAARRRRCRPGHARPVSSINV